MVLDNGCRFNGNMPPPHYEISIVALLVTSGCFHVAHRPSWKVVSVTDLADDETTPEGTADEFLALLTLDSEMPTTWQGGTDTTASVFV